MLDNDPRQVYNTDMSNNKKGKLNRILLYLFIIALLLLYAIIYLLPMVTGALTKTSLVEYGSLQVIDDVTCYFVRNEKVYNANSSGTIQYYFEEGELVRKGSKILELLPGGESYTAEDNSIISYYIDGLENTFTPEKMTSLNKNEIESLNIEVHNTKRKSAISGEPIYKTVDNSAWYAIFWVENENIIKYTKNSSVFLNLPLGQIKGVTYDIIDDKGKWLVVLKFTRYYEDLPKLRKVKAEVTVSDYEGLIIANKSITTKDGKPGVYVKDISGQFVFTPVSVITSNGEHSLVEASFFYEKEGDKNIKVNTVNVYDEILNNPERK